MHRLLFHPYWLKVPDDRGARLVGLAIAMGPVVCLIFLEEALGWSRGPLVLAGYAAGALWASLVMFAMIRGGVARVGQVTRRANREAARLVRRETRGRRWR